MKRLNKKGFTLVELLAVVVILAILITVVATTAIPAMKNAKVKAAETYAARLNQKAKEACMVEHLGDGDCTYAASVKDGDGNITAEEGMKELMGAASKQYEITEEITVEISSGVATVKSGVITDKGDSSITAEVKD